MPKTKKKFFKGDDLSKKRWIAAGVGQGMRGGRGSIGGRGSR